LSLTFALLKKHYPSELPISKSIRFIFKSWFSSSIRWTIDNDEKQLTLQVPLTPTK
jgi:hypothetical protein